MIKGVLFFLSIFYTLSAFPQEKLDNAYLKCQYKHTWQFDTLEIQYGMMI